MNSERTAQNVATGLGFGAVAAMAMAMAILALSGKSSDARAFFFQGTSPRVKEIVRRFGENPGKARADIQSLYRRNGIVTGDDYVEAARILASSSERSELALAFDLAIGGLSLGSPAAKRIVVLTEDRLFKMTGLGERYGTLGAPNPPLTLRHRLVMGVGAHPSTGSAAHTEIR